MYVYLLILLHLYDSIAQFVTIYGLMFIATGSAYIPYENFIVIWWGEMQVFDERQELIKTMKGKSLRKMSLDKCNNDKNAD